MQNTLSWEVIRVPGLVPNSFQDVYTETRWIQWGKTWETASMLEGGFTECKNFVRLSMFSAKFPSRFFHSFKRLEKEKSECYNHELSYRCEAFFCGLRQVSKSLFLWLEYDSHLTLRTHPVSSFYLWLWIMSKLFTTYHRKYSICKVLFFSF